MYVHVYTCVRVWVGYVRSKMGADLQPSRVYKVAPKHVTRRARRRGRGHSGTPTPRSGREVSGPE